jgi:hypothetical protein
MVEYSLIAAALIQAPFDHRAQSLANRASQHAVIDRIDSCFGPTFGHSGPTESSGPRRRQAPK